MVCRFGARIPEGDQGDVGERVARGPVADGQRGAESPWALLTPPWAFSDGYTMTIDSKLRMKFLSKDVLLIWLMDCQVLMYCRLKPVNIVTQVTYLCPSVSPSRGSFRE